MKTGKGLLGVLAAIVAGIFIGILTAPNKGEQTRKNLRDKVNSFFKK
jgi:gas vesicle protein